MNGNRLLLTATVAGTALVLAPALSWAQTPVGPGYHGYGHMMWAGGQYGMIFGPLVMILVLAVVIATAVLLVRWLGGPGQGAAPHQPAPPVRTPLDILKERFARGEIDKEEFEERRRLLGE